MNLLTIMYIAVQETLNDPEEMSPTYGKLRMYRQTFATLLPPSANFFFFLASVANMGWIVELNPSLVDFLMLAISKLRWDEQNAMPHTQVKSLSFYFFF